MLYDSWYASVIFQWFRAITNHPVESGGPPWTAVDHRGRPKAAGVWCTSHPQMSFHRREDGLPWPTRFRRTGGKPIWRPREEVYSCLCWILASASHIRSSPCVYDIHPIYKYVYSCALLIRFRHGSVQGPRHGQHFPSGTSFLEQQLARKMFCQMLIHSKYSNRSGSVPLHRFVQVCWNRGTPKSSIYINRCSIHTPSGDPPWVRKPTSQVPHSVWRKVPLSVAQTWGADERCCCWPKHFVSMICTGIRPYPEPFLNVICKRHTCHMFRTHQLIMIIHNCSPCRIILAEVFSCWILCWVQNRGGSHLPARIAGRHAMHATMGPGSPGVLWHCNGPAENAEDGSPEMAGWRWQRALQRYRKWWEFVWWLGRFDLWFAKLEIGWNRIMLPLLILVMFFQRNPQVNKRVRTVRSFWRPWPEREILAPHTIEFEPCSAWVFVRWKGKIGSWPKNAWKAPFQRWTYPVKTWWWRIPTLHPLPSPSKRASSWRSLSWRRQELNFVDAERCWTEIWKRFSKKFTNRWAACQVEDSSSSFITCVLSWYTPYVILFLRILSALSFSRFT